MRICFGVKQSETGTKSVEWLNSYTNMMGVFKKNVVFCVCSDMQQKWLHELMFPGISTT